MGWWHSWYPSAEAFSLGALSITWYGIILVIAIVTGSLLAYRLFQKKQVPSDHFYGLLFWLLIAGVVGGRIGNIVAEWSVYRSDFSQVLRIWEGGLSIHGVIIAGIIAVWGYCRYYRLSFWKIADIIAVVLPLMQAIGRWGNYFNQELYGPSTDGWWGIPISPAHRLIEYLTSTHFQPLFLYESVLMLGLFIVLWVVYQRHALRDGEYLLLYITAFSVIRFCLDFLRLDPPMFGPLTIAQWLSVVFALGAIGLLIFRRRSKYVG